MFKHIIHNRLTGVFLSVILLFLFFSNTLQEFLFSDDLVFYLIKNSYQDKSFATVLRVIFSENEWWMQNGRFYPLYPTLSNVVLFNASTVMSYRWYILLINFAGIASFLLFLRTIGAKINPFVWVLCICCLMQFRVQYHDVYTTIQGTYQFLSILVFSSLTFYVTYVQKKRWHYLAISLLFYTSALLLMEIGLAVFLFIPATALLLKVPLKNIVKHVVPYLILTIFYLGYVAWIKSKIISSSYTGIQPNVHPPSMLSLLWRQLYASLPLTNMHSIAAIPLKLLYGIKGYPVVIALIIVIAAVIAVFFIKKENEKKPVTETRWILYFLLLMTVPSLFITPSLKYQQEVKIGVGYLPIYFQNLSLAVLFTYFIQYCFAFTVPAVQLLVRLILVFIIAVTFIFNTAMLNDRMYYYSEPALAQYQSVKEENIMKDVPAGSIIRIDYLWNNGWIYHQIFPNLTGKNYTVYNDDAVAPYTTDSTTVCFVLETLPGDTLYTKLYELNCTTGERGKVLATRIHKCRIPMVKVK